MSRTRFKHPLYSPKFAALMFLFLTGMFYYIELLYRSKNESNTTIIDVLGASAFWEAIFYFANTINSCLLGGGDKSSYLTTSLPGVYLTTWGSHYVISSKCSLHSGIGPLALMIWFSQKIAGMLLDDAHPNDSIQVKEFHKQLSTATKQYNELIEQSFKNQKNIEKIKEELIVVDHKIEKLRHKRGKYRLFPESKEAVASKQEPKKLPKGIGFFEQLQKDRESVKKEQSQHVAKRAP